MCFTQLECFTAEADTWFYLIRQVIFIFTKLRGHRINIQNMVVETFQRKLWASLFLLNSLNLLEFGTVDASLAEKR